MSPLGEIPVNQWDFMQFLSFFGPKLVLAIVCGGVIGLERELKAKAAGVKTNMMICVGAALYSAVSVLISEQHAGSGYFGDPARIAAQIVSGIGFLGGGAIIQARGTVVGLTTAATIWVVAAIGLSIGIGFERFALLATGMVVAVLVSITLLERKFIDRTLHFACEILLEDSEGTVRRRLYDVMKGNDLLLDDSSISTKGDLIRMRLRYKGRMEDQRKFVMELWTIPGVREVKQE